MQNFSLRRRLLTSAALSPLLGLGACTIASDYDHASDDAPSFDLARVQSARMAWVLSSGGPRGFVHVGVLRALDELGCKPDLVVGGSVGSLVGALYACGIPATQMQTMALDLGITDMGRLAMGGEGRFSGNPIAEFINRELHGLPIERLPVRFAVAALERQSRKPVLFNTGNTGLAVQASCAIEGMFTPVRIRSTQFVDADMATPLPVRLARSLGARKVLAIDASAHEDKAPEGALRFRDSDLLKRALTAADAKVADLTLHPDFGYWVSTKREFRERAIRAGYEQTMARGPELRALHAA